jgi:hypothetical protein
MSADKRLESILEEVRTRRHRLHQWTSLARCWGAFVLVSLAVLILERLTGWGTWLAMPVLAAAAFIAGVIVLVRAKQTQLTWSQIAHLIEQRFPHLDGRLLTAVEQNSKDRGELNYLQQKVLEETLAFSKQDDWKEIVPKSHVTLAKAGHWLALLILILTILNLPKTQSRELLARITDFSVSVVPGNASVERGSSLVIFARFGRLLPPGVDLVIQQSSDQKRLQLAKSLADPIFGGSISEVTTNMVYHLEYAGQRTPDFTITVFDYPRLERADADLTYPSYTGQSPKRIENTPRLSAVEGSHLDLTLQLNKPVRSAQFITKDNERAVLPLQVESNKPLVSLKGFELATSKSYDLLLIDSEGRTNKTQVQFVFDAVKNRTPELKLTSPRGDLHPSPLEEVSFEGTVWDDFGVEAYGLAYEVPGQEPRFIQLGGKVAAKDKSPFKYVLRLEDLGIQADQLVAWFAWADDKGTNGKVRRTAGDLFFAEVRGFDEIFREGMQGDAGGGGGGGGGGQTDGGKLLELQKKITSATWNLQRQYGTPLSPEKSAKPVLRDEKLEPSKSVEPTKQRESNLLKARMSEIASGHTLDEPVPLMQSRLFGQVSAGQSEAIPQIGGRRRTRTSNAVPGKGRSYQEDAVVVHDSMAQALEQAQGIAEEQRDPRGEALWLAAVNEMKKALELLAAATNSPKPLTEAVVAEQAVYQALLKVREHEYEVIRNSNRNQNQGGGGGGERMQRQLEQLEMTQSENRYETQRQAQRPQNNQAREQLQVQNRLQELARRQQDLNERLKELQTALQEARTEQEREEIRRRLKRLQEEEQQMLADVDEVRQRMDRAENQSRMADERRQLEQTREDIQHAADAASQGSVSQALAAGTRAQRQLQELRDQMRKESSNQFAEDLRQMRADARELSRQQEDISKKLSPEREKEGPKSLTDAPEREQLMKQLAEQKERMTNLVDRATHVSEEAEVAEPLLSRQLYDSLRKFSQDNLKSMKQAEEDLLRRGLMSENRYDRFKQSPDPDAAKLLDITSELLRQDARRHASEIVQRSRDSINEFRQGVERAAESVLGDDTETLRLAQDQLTKLAQDLEREMTQVSTNGAASQNGDRQQPSSRKGQPGESAAAQPSPRNPGEQSSNQPGEGSTETERDQANSSRQANEGAQNSNEGSPKGQQPGSTRGGQQTQTGSQSSQQAGGQQAGNESGRTVESGDVNSNDHTDAGSPQTARRSGNNRTQRGGTTAGWGNDWGGAWLDNFNRVNNDDVWLGGPLTGGDFGPWSDRLREIEEILEFPDLRNEVAAARERARLMRQDFKRDQKKPDWAVVRLQVMKPLLEVRDRIADELARRDSNDALVPIDRDPVPTRYSDLVRRYYEELGKNNAPAK